MKNFFKEFLPPFVFKLLKYLTNLFKINFLGKKQIYDQRIYKNYNEIQKERFNQSVWESKNWISHVKNSLKKKNINIHEDIVLKSMLSISQLSNNRNIHVIDYGGGAGVLIDKLINFAKKNKINLIISLIDNETNINIAKKNFSNINFLNFYHNEENFISNFKKNDTTKFLTILNISSVLQYVINYRSFLERILKQINPKIACITRFVRCDNATVDAFTIQNVYSSYGFCGSTIVNLFQKNSLPEIMSSLSYEILSEKYDKIGDAEYFVKCDEEKYRQMTLMSYAYINTNSENV